MDHRISIMDEYYPHRQKFIDEFICDIFDKYQATLPADMIANLVILRFVNDPSKILEVQEKSQTMPNPMPMWLKHSIEIASMINVGASMEELEHNLTVGKS